MAFLALEKIRKRFAANDQRRHSRSCSLNRENPGRSIKTRRDSTNSFFENETIFVFITPRLWTNLALKKQFHNARSLQENNSRLAANQSARTVVAV